MSDARESIGLPAGLQLGRYRLEKISAAWGFYLTYLARDTDGRSVAVHELLPEELVTRAANGEVTAKTESAQKNMAWAREEFLREGRALMACAHPSLQKIIEVFEANGTAYWVTPRDEPLTLKGWLQDRGHSPDEPELERLLEPLLAALEEIHAASRYHLNLKPDSIQITPAGKPVLTHFGGARQAIARHCHESVAVTTGYSAPEQYDVQKAEGAATDIYGLAAVLYRAIAGQAPPDAEQRLDRDPYEPLAGRFAGQYRESFLTAIDTALALDPAVRPASVREWREKLGIEAGDNLSGYLRRYRTFSLIGFAAVVAVAMALSFIFRLRPSPTPSPSPTPTTTVTPVTTPTATSTPVLTPTATLTPTSTPTAATATAVKTSTPVVTPKPTPTPTPIASVTPVRTPTPAVTPMVSFTPAPTSTPNPTRSAAISPTPNPTLTSPSVTPSATRESSNSPKEQHTGAKSELEKQAKEKADGAAEDAKKAEAAKRAAETAAKAEAEKAATAKKSAKVADALAAVQKTTSEEAAAAKTLAEKAAAEKQAAEAATRLAQEAKVDAANKNAEKAAAEAQAVEKTALKEIADAKEVAAEKSVATASAKERLAQAAADLKTLQAQLAAANAEEAKTEAAGKQTRSANVRDAAVKAEAEEAKQKADDAQRDAESAAAEKDKAETWVVQAAAETEEKKQAAAKIVAERVAAEKAEKAMQEQRAAAEKAAAEKAAAEKAGNDPNAGKYKQAQTTPSPGPQPSVINAQGSTGTGLAGIWETTSTDAQGKPNRRLIIYADGRYQISDNQGWRDNGVILAKMGRIQMLSDASKLVVRSSFKLRTLSKIVTAGALGDEEWQRVQASPGNDPNPPKK